MIFFMIRNNCHTNHYKPKYLNNNNPLLEPTLGTKPLPEQMLADHYSLH